MCAANMCAALVFVYRQSCVYAKKLYEIEIKCEPAPTREPPDHAFKRTHKLRAYYNMFYYTHMYGICTNTHYRHHRGSPYPCIILPMV